MKNVVASIGCFLLLSLLTYPSFAKDFRFVAIENSTEQLLGSELISRIYAELGYSIEVQSLPAIRAQLVMSLDQFDGEVLRKADYDLVNTNVKRVPTPIYYLETRAYSKRQLDLLVTAPEDLSAYHVAIVRGVRHTTLMSAHAKHVTEFSSVEQMFRFVNAGRADIALSSFLDGVMTLNRLNYYESFVYSEALSTEELFHFIHSKHQAIFKQVATKFADLHNNGKLAQLIFSVTQDLLSKVQVEGKKA